MKRQSKCSKCGHVTYIPENSEAIDKGKFKLCGECKKFIRRHRRPLIWSSSGDSDRGNASYVNHPDEDDF